jgi:predicted Zn-dependent peptidase
MAGPGTLLIPKTKISSRSARTLGPEFQTETLTNGLRVVAVPQRELHRAHVALYVRVGSRFETKETNGISHFLEHMIYRGTSTLPSAHLVNLAFERLGGYLYAATQSDFGVFSVTLPPESLDDACKLFGEVLRAPAFFDIELEKGIVEEEILEDLDDEGRDVDADNLSRRMIYPNHPLGFTITGSSEQVKSFDDAMLRAHHARHYTATSSVLAFSGAIDPAHAIDLARRDFSTLPRGERVLTDPPQHLQKKPRFKLIENASSQTELRVCMRAISERSKERPAIDMLMRILDDGMSTRLYHRICDSQGLCYDVSASFDGYEDDGIVDFAAGVQHSRGSIVTHEILEMMKELADVGPSDDELAKAKKRNAWEVTAMLDSTEDLAGFYAGGFLFDRFETPWERLSNNAKVTKEHVRDVARMLIEPDRLNVIAVGLPEEEDAKKLADVVRNFRA